MYLKYVMISEKAKHKGYILNLYDMLNLIYVTSREKKSTVRENI